MISSGKFQYCISENVVLRNEILKVYLKYTLGGLGVNLKKIVNLQNL